MVCNGRSERCFISGWVFLVKICKNKVLTIKRKTIKLIMIIIINSEIFIFYVVS